MTKLPIRRQQVKVERFLVWLAENGAEVGTPTNPYEVVRYRAYWKKGLFRAIAAPQHRATHEPSRSVSALRVGIAIAARCIGVGVMLGCVWLIVSGAL